MTHFIKLIALVFCVNCAYAWDNYFYYGFETGPVTSSNTVNVYIPSLFTTLAAKTGDIGFQTAIVSGKKYFFDTHGSNIAYEASMGYNSFDKILFNYTVNDPSKPSDDRSLSFRAHSGLFYEIATHLGQERSDYNLYLISKLRSERWTIQNLYPQPDTSDEQRTTDDITYTTVRLTSKKTMISFGIGLGTELALSDKVSGRLQYMYYLPTKQHSTTSIDGLTFITHNKLSQQTVSLAVLY